MLEHGITLDLVSLTRQTPLSMMLTPIVVYAMYFLAQSKRPISILSTGSPDPNSHPLGVVLWLRNYHNTQSWYTT
jgi:hypothetical protein